MLYENIAFRTMVAATQLQMAWVDDELSTQPLRFLYQQVLERSQIFGISVPDFDMIDRTYETFGRDVGGQIIDKFPYLHDFVSLGQTVSLLALTNFGDIPGLGGHSTEEFAQTILEITTKYGIASEKVRSWITEGKKKMSPLYTVIDFEKNILRDMVPFVSPLIEIPPTIKDSLARFKIDYPNQKKVGFIMMQFASTPIHGKISEAIRSSLKAYGITALRADDKEYHDDLFGNIMTYIYGCGFGIAVFERLQSDEFNPNVSFEVGYMIALGRPVCLLKDKTLRTLNADLAGKLYRPFDVQKPKISIQQCLKEWILGKGLHLSVTANKDNTSNIGLNPIKVRNAT